METNNLLSGNKRIAVPILLAVAAVSIAVFFNSLGGGFVYDDHFLVVKEPIIREFSFENILRHFTYGKQTHYLPVRLLSYTFDYAIWGGLNPFGFHVTNLLLHALNTMLAAAACALVCFRAGGMTARKAWLAGGAAALLFCAHPIQVESVAWISGRKDLLSTFFLLCSFLLYMKTFTSPAGERRAELPLYLAFLLFFPAMFSKASVLGYPMVLAAAEVFLKPGPGREKISARVERLLPFFMACAAVLAADVFLSRKTGIIAGYFGGSPLTHYLTIIRIPLLYLRNIVWPFNLCAEYSFVPATSLFSAATLLPAAAGILILSAFLYLAKKDRAAAFFMAWALLNLAPVMNIFPTSKLIADRYAYLPSIGFFMLVGYLAVKWSSGPGTEIRKSCVPAVAACLVILSIAAGLSFMSVQRNLIWKSDFSLWSDAMKQEPENAVVLHNMGFAYYEKGDINTARALLEKALRVAPNDVSAMVNLGAIEHQTNGSTDKALQYFKTASELEPHRIQAWVNLFVVYLEREDFREARKACLGAIAQEPYNPDHYDRMNILIRRAKEKGVELEPLAPPPPGP